LTLPEPEEVDGKFFFEISILSSALSTTSERSLGKSGIKNDPCSFNSRLKLRFSRKGIFGSIDFHGKCGNAAHAIGTI
jgi:hypothetical protein